METDPTRMRELLVGLARLIRSRCITTDAMGVTGRQLVYPSDFHNSPAVNPRIQARQVPRWWPQASSRTGFGDERKESVALIG